MTATLESLELTPEQLSCCKDVVREMAYFNWLDAGCPDAGQIEFWLKAQRDWIERFYVPNRAVDGELPQSCSSLATVGELRQEPGPSQARRGSPETVKAQKPRRT